MVLSLGILWYSRKFLIADTMNLARALGLPRCLFNDCGRLSSLTQDVLTRGKVGFLSRRTGPYPRKEESKRGAASERTPLFSATTAPGAAGQEVGVRRAPVKTNRAPPQ